MEFKWLSLLFLLQSNTISRVQSGWPEGMIVLFENCFFTIRDAEIRVPIEAYRFLQAHLIPAICQFCQMAIQDLSPLSSDDVRKLSSSHEWGNGELLVDALAMGLKTISNIVVEHHGFGRAQARIDFKAMGWGPTLSLLEEAGAVLRLVGDRVLDDGNTVYKLALGASSYMAGLMSVMLSSNLHLSSQLYEQQCYWALWQDMTQLLHQHRACFGSLDLLLSDPDPALIPSDLCPSEQQKPISPLSTDPSSPPPPHAIQPPLLPTPHSQVHFIQRYQRWLSQGRDDAAPSPTPMGEGVTAPTAVAENPHPSILSSDLRRVMDSSIWDSLLHCSGFVPVCGVVLAVCLYQAMVVVEAQLLSGSGLSLPHSSKETDALLSSSSSDVLKLVSHGNSLMGCLLSDASYYDVEAINAFMTSGRRALSSMRDLVCHLGASLSSTNGGSGSRSGSGRSVEPSDVVSGLSSPPSPPPSSSSPTSKLSHADVRMGASPSGDARGPA